MAQTLKNLPAMQETQVQPMDREDSPREGNGNPQQYSRLENPMDRGAWWATVHGVSESDKTECMHACAHTPLLRTHSGEADVKGTSE